jgi:hypothetical protein
MTKHCVGLAFIAHVQHTENRTAMQYGKSTRAGRVPNVYLVRSGSHLRCPVELPTLRGPLSCLSLRITVLVIPPFREESEGIGSEGG